MNKRTLSIIGLVILGIILFLGGMFFGQSQANAAFFPGSMMYGNSTDSQYDGYNMMGNGLGMMGGASMMSDGFDMMGSGVGMMGGMMGNGMMDRYGFEDPTSVDPLSIEDTQSALTEFLFSLGNDDLDLGEIMIFENHAYAQILDKSSESGAFEVLIDPVSGDVYQEPGPSMMWNTEYGQMSNFGGFGMMGGMMGGYAADGDTNVSNEEAKKIAQRYLDTYMPGTTADETADQFPGYYTIHILSDGETSGMLSVNAYTSQVFLHHWHGDFVEMAGDEHE